MKRSQVAVLAIGLSWAAFGQEFRGTFNGMVSDSTGASIGGAKVATELLTGTKTQTVSEGAGQYT